jgi:hypothetical protein
MQRQVPAGEPDACDPAKSEHKTLLQCTISALWGAAEWIISQRAAFGASLDGSTSAA